MEAMRAEAKGLNNEPPNAISFGRLHISVVFILPFLFAGLALFLSYRDQHHSTVLSGILERVKSIETEANRYSRDIRQLQIASATTYQKVKGHEHSAPPKEWKEAVVKNTEARIQLFAKREVNTLENAWAGRFSEQRRLIGKLKDEISALSKKVGQIEKDKRDNSGMSK